MIGTEYIMCTWLPLKPQGPQLPQQATVSLTHLSHSLVLVQSPASSLHFPRMRDPSHASCVTHINPRLSAWPSLGSPRLRSSPACLVAGKAATAPCLLSAFSRRGGRETATRRHRRQPPPAPLLRLRLRPRRRLHLQLLLQHLHPRPLTGLSIKSPRRVPRMLRRPRAPHRWEWPRYQPRPEEEEYM